MRIKILLLCALATSLCCNFSYAQNNDAYKKEYFIKKGDTLPYRILLPKNYDPAKKYPLLLFLHGSGERGKDNSSQLMHGANLFAQDENRNAHPAIVVFPQCRANSSWARIGVEGEGADREFVFYEKSKPTQDMLLLEGLLKYLKKNYKLERGQLYVGGLSMGGMGTFELVRRNPRMFAAAFPICGGANPKIGKRLRKSSWWVFHGTDDKSVPEKYSAQMVEAMEKEGINVKYSVYPGVGHNSWDNAFAEPELLTWIFSKSR